MIQLMKKWGLGVSASLLLVLTGCFPEEQRPTVTEVETMSNLDGGLGTEYGPYSPVLQDVYDRSIPEEVYSGE
ncbi:hypothetical protein [Paenibacillus donghaensis]|uniref:Uncharacterized protein n=1 Tax=Paenibacillus donghaensis TaxID=414771 RepID=A0A2Z2K7H1_9BACL|nr:hypothetical protein [Paenibacillus donghaensis]ASA20994.1 hypothetical protein B9T62_09465 [Paenibacillus donghaensis]